MGLGVRSLSSLEAVFLSEPQRWLVSWCLSPWTHLPDFLSTDLPVSLLPSGGAQDAIGCTLKIQDPLSISRSADQQPSPLPCNGACSQVPALGRGHLWGAVILTTTGSHRAVCSSPSVPPAPHSIGWWLRASERPGVSSWFSCSLCCVTRGKFLNLSGIPPAPLETHQWEQHL